MRYSPQCPGLPANQPRCQDQGGHSWPEPSRKRIPFRGFFPDKIIYSFLSKNQAGGWTQAHVLGLIVRWKMQKERRKGGALSDFDR